jgi:hypothetical protein
MPRLVAKNGRPYAALGKESLAKELSPLLWVALIPLAVWLYDRQEVRRGRI